VIVLLIAFEFSVLLHYFIKWQDTALLQITSCKWIFHSIWRYYLA